MVLFYYGNRELKEFIDLKSCLNEKVDDKINKYIKIIFYGMVEFVSNKDN